MRSTFILTFLYSSILFFSCKKSDPDDGDGSSSNANVSFRVDGQEVKVTGDYNSRPEGEGSSFVYNPGSALVQPFFTFTASTPKAKSVLGIFIPTGKLSTGTYTIGRDQSRGTGVALKFEGKDYATITGDSTLMLNVIISRYKDGRADGTFSGKLARLDGTDSEGNALYEYVQISNGSFKNVLVK